MKTFNSMIPMTATCVRDGILRTETPVCDLVRGDIVHVRAGDVIPADMRIIDSKGFKVDNSSLTGECVAVSRSNTEGTANILESQNVAFFSALCVEGWAVGVVICCGDLTALGRIAGLAARLRPAPSPLSREIRTLMRLMSAWAIGLGIFIAGASLALGYPFMQSTIFVIGIVVANIPEGLQPTVTASLTLTAKRMITKNCLVKNLEAMEALGACTTICSDKTGTLTENKMRVRHLWIEHEIYEATDIGLKTIIEILVSIHLNQQTLKHLLVIKGAPEVILARSSTIALSNRDINIDNEVKEFINTAIETMANTGERILAFADLDLNETNYPQGFEFDSEEINFPVENVRFLGLLGLIDPPREEVRSAIQRVRAAGVRVMMVTGDHPATARAVASEVGIGTTPSCHVVTGTELRNMTPELLFLTLEKNYEIVFARTSPTQKLQIVEACQRQGSVVAVTGDGVNDAPALRRADIGISMGITGSQVSKQTADIILMDDNFATIVTGIEEGRKIFDNLKKSVCYILISNVPEIIPVLMFILFSIPLPLGVMTILCVDLGTDMWPAVSLAHEEAEQDVMGRPPRKSDPLVSCPMIRLVYGHLGLIEFAAGMFAYFIVMAEHGFYPDQLFGNVICFPALWTMASSPNL
ncbi:unnamed protein product [Leptosia nina]|uniref:Na(+)/K(+)-exchanging ATPase n=1 Tax=Leptosia nina TaxID=320188 RepID=A0AAV1K3U0_9NEOP